MPPCGSERILDLRLRFESIAGLKGSVRLRFLFMERFMLATRAEGRGNAHVAQLVEHVLGKDEVTGSIPVVSPELIGDRRERERVIEGPRKSFARRVFRSYILLRSRLQAGVTQLVESQPSKLLVAGSSPVSRSNFVGVFLFLEIFSAKLRVLS